MRGLGRWLSLRRLIAIALLLALWTPLGAPTPVVAWQTIPLTGEQVGGSPLALVGSAEITLPPGSTTAVWLIERQAGAIASVGSAKSALVYALPRRPLPNMHGEHRAARAASSAGRTPRLTPGEIIPLYAALTDAAMSVQFTLVPAGTFPAGAIASEPFITPGGRIRLELRQGLLAPGQQITIPVGDRPVVLLAVDNPMQIEQARDAAIVMRHGELTLLDAETVIRNTGARVATFAVARVAPAPDTATADQPTAPREVTFGSGDAALDAAWRRFGCALNPGNPACLTVGLAAACAGVPFRTGCDGDSDADSCLDIAEVRAGLDPFEPADCIGSRDGSPLLNCLFVAGNLTCDGHHGDGGDNRCSPPADPRRGPRLGDTDECRQEPRPPGDACQILHRDPACDGFAP